MDELLEYLWYGFVALLALSLLRACAEHLGPPAQTAAPQQVAQAASTAPMPSSAYLAKEPAQLTEQQALEQEKQRLLQQYNALQQRLEGL